LILPHPLASPGHGTCILGKQEPKPTFLWIRAASSATLGAVAAALTWGLAMASTEGRDRRQAGLSRGAAAGAFGFTLALDPKDFAGTCILVRDS